MRVAFVSMETVHHRDTEGNQRMQRVAEQLVEAGHDVTVYCSQWWGGDGQRFEPEDITYRAVTQNDSTPWFSTRLPTLLARDRPDVIHARPAPPSAVVAARIGASLARAPLLVDWFGDEDVPESPMATSAVKSPARIVTPSEMVRTRVRERGASVDQTAIVPESIDVDLVRETDADDEVDVAFAHPLDDSANLESLLLGLAELREKDWSATVIGDGPHRDDYERQAADLRIDDRVEFVGSCDREQRVSIYKGAHVFAQTAFREYFATELLWALACGCVGIVEYQARSSAHELIEHRERSFRVTSTQQMADAIVDSGDYERKQFDDDFERFDHDVILGEYVDLYEALVAEFGWF